jgi:hypothetical protein
VVSSIVTDLIQVLLQVPFSTPLHPLQVLISPKHVPFRCHTLAMRLYVFIVPCKCHIRNALLSAVSTLTSAVDRIHSAHGCN